MIGTAGGDDPKSPRARILARLAERAQRARELEALLSSPEVASDGRRVGGLSRELGALRPMLEAYERHRRLEEIVRGNESMLAEPGLDPEMRQIAEAEIAEKRAEADAVFEGLKRLLVSEDADSQRDAIVEIRAGTGGDEAALFARDLFELYDRLAKRRGWRLEVLDGNPTEHGGIKTISFSLSGQSVFRDMRFESGVHRVQRVPQTETQGRIHTSTATVAVLPEAEEVDVEIRPQDIQEDFMRAGGPGGQNVNKTSSAVRLTHIPTGEVVKCQDESSQRKNRDRAMRILRARLYELRREEAARTRAADRRSQVGTGDRSEKIRTYHFKESRVTDHRIGLTTHDLDRVLQGDLDRFHEALREADLEERLRDL
jgi:peptide chain release factor 1